jgi:hypothetical protein
MNLNHFYHYYKSKSGGVSNLLLGSEELDQSDQGEWVRYNMNAVNANVPGVANPLSSDETVEQLDFEASTVARIAQTVTLTAGTEYTFSVWARAASGTQPFRLRYWDSVGGSGGGSAFTASATWSASTGRYEMTFTAANSGTFQMFIQNAGGTAVSRRIYFWGAMLNVGGSALDYVKTEFPAGPSNPPTAPMEFGDNFAGVTAYYSLRRFTKGEDNNAIRVRRSSDDTEQDIGFDSNGDLDTTALLAFVNADVVVQNPDFSTSDGNYSGINGTRTINQSVGGRTGVLSFELTNGDTDHYLRNLSKPTDEIQINFDFFIPSTNAVVDAIYVRDGSGGAAGTVSATDVWTNSGDLILDTTSIQLRLVAALSSNPTASVDADGDFIYIDNLTITQTTADGAVTTFYDQTGNGNDATNSTESEQPLVVSGGTLVEENGKAALEFDGSADALNFTELNLGDNSWFINAVYKSTRTTLEDYLLYGASGQTRIRIYTTTARMYVSNVSYSFTIDSHRNTQQLFTFEADASKGLSVYQNGTEKGTEQTIATNDSFDPSSIGQSQSTRTIDGLVQEIIIFDSDQSANLGTVTTGGGTLIQGNINTYFDIV